MSAYAESLTGLMGAVAAQLLGEPNKHLSNPNDGLLRFGSHGAIEVNVNEGWFSDYEDAQKGGVLELVKHKSGAIDDAAAFRWLEEKGIKKPSAKPTASTSRPLQTFYDYRDEHGTVLFRVECLANGNGPRFIQHGPNGRGGFHAVKGCMRGVRRVPYRLPELIAADQAEIVYVCEGEKDVDNLADRGLVATTNAGGAGKFDAAFAPLFAGRRVAVLQDNDDAGRRHAEDVRDKLAGAADCIAILSLPGADKSDVSDWLREGGSAFELTRRAEDKLEKTAVSASIACLDLAALASVTPKPKRFVIPGLAPEAEVTLFSGPGSAGKSLWVQQMASAMAAGVATLGITMDQAPAIYLTCEDDAEQLHWRQAAICRALNVSMCDLADTLHLASLRGCLDNALGVSDGKGNFTLSPAYARLETLIKRTRARFVALDNVAHLFAGNENDRGEVTQFVNALNRLAGDTGAAIVLIGDTNKAFIQGDRQGNSASGSTAWINAVRSQIVLEHDEITDVRKLTAAKANYARKGDVMRFLWHDGAFFREADLSADVSRALADTARANGENTAFLTCLAKVTEERRNVSHAPSAGNYAPRVFTGMTIGKGHTVKGYAACCTSAGSRQTLGFFNTTIALGQQG